jgi:hypothetical protein
MAAGRDGFKQAGRDGFFLRCAMVVTLFILPAAIQPMAKWQHAQIAKWKNSRPADTPGRQ